MARFGWAKDARDTNDFLHPTMRLAKLPESIDLSAFLPAVRDQGNVGSCTGHGIGAIVTATYIQQKSNPEWESPTWIYNLGRMVEGTLSWDAGAQPRDCLDQLVKLGLLKEHFWPYDPSKFDKNQPNTAQLAAALKWADFKYYRCVDGVDGISSALADGHVVSIGAPWFDKWMTPGPDGLLAVVSAVDAIDGGHETCLYGYNQTEQVFLGMNSWGTGWGKSGFYKMPFSALDVFKQSTGYDAHYVMFTPTPVPAPTPTPTPTPTPGPGCLTAPLAWPAGIFRKMFKLTSW
jgi:hypothetical protein